MITRALKDLLRPLLPPSFRGLRYPYRERAANIPANLRARWRIWWRIRVRGEILSDLGPFEFKVFSQNAEDGILEAIFARVGATNRWFVEFGVEDGRECNTRLLKERGWRGLQMDPKEDNPADIRRELVTADNINGLFAKYGVPKEFDLLSIDIDSNDYWVWKALIGFRPRVVVIEYNGTIPPAESRAIAYDPGFRHQGTAYFGASLLALRRLGAQKGYELVACDSRGVNAFFVSRDLVPDRFAPRPLEEIYRPLGEPYRGRVAPVPPGKTWVECP